MKRAGKEKGFCFQRIGTPLQDSEQVRRWSLCGDAQGVGEEAGRPPIAEDGGQCLKQVGVANGGR